MINITDVISIYSSSTTSSSSLTGGNPSSSSSPAATGRVIGIKVLYTVSYNTYIPSSSVDPGVSSASLSATIQNQVAQTLESAVTSGDFSTQFIKSCSQSCSMTSSVPGTVFSVLNPPTAAPSSSPSISENASGSSNNSSNSGTSLLSTILLPLVAAVVGLLVLTSIIVYYKYVYSIHSGGNNGSNTETQIIKNEIDTSVKLEPDDYDVDFGDVYRNDDRRNDKIAGVNPLSPRKTDIEGKDGTSMQPERKVNLLDMIYGAENHNHLGANKLALNAQRK